jgi:multiple sugar transport system ATP-binding protein
MATVELRDVEKVYPNGHVAAHDLDLRVADGELLVLVGPSGCGKSTALRMVAGLETPTSGQVFIGGRDVTGVPPQDRDVAMVFQNYALYPHMTVRENLAFGLRMRGVDDPERERRAVDVARALGLEELMDRKPGQLSGGQRQRVALGRATVRDPRVFLFDEPLSNLDAKLRVQTRAELARLHRRIDATMMYVTHDQEEAMTLGQRVAVMNDGRLEQVAPPMEVFHSPATRFVAGFVGSPAMNFLPGRLARGEGSAEVRGAGWRVEISDGGAAGDESGPDEPAGAGAPGTSGGGASEDGPEGGGAEDAGGRDVVLGVRPSDVDLVAPEDGDLTGAVDVVEPLGSEVLVHVRPPEGALSGEEDEMRVLADPEDAPPVEERVGVRFRRDRLHLFDGASGRRLVPTA